MSAIKFFQRAIQIELGHSYVYCLLGHELMIVEDYEAALKSYEKALSLNKMEFYAYWGMGNVFLKKDQNQKAFNYFSLASNLNPNCSVLYTYMGLTQSNLGKHDMALLYFRRTEHLDPTNMVNVFHKAQALYHLKMIPQAKSELERLLQQSIHDSKIYFLLGMINQNIKNYEKAHENYNFALNLDPKDSQKKIRNCIDQLNTLQQEEGEPKGKENYCSGSIKLN